MNDIEIENHQQAVEGLHDCKATFTEIIHVKETFEGDLIWEGDVYVFLLEGHPKSQMAYAWSSPIEGSENRDFYAVLHFPPVQSAQDAVRASILSDYKGD